MKTGVTICGAGVGASVLKLKDDATNNWDFVLGTHLGGTYADIDNVVIRQLTVDGNKSFLIQSPGIAEKIADGTCQMHGITLYGEHDGWLIDGVRSQNTGGDGIMVTAASSGSKIPTDVRIENCTQSGCGRQDIAIVNVSGCTISGCSGTGTFDVEANNASETCERIVLSDLRYDKIHVSTLSATGGTGYDLVSCTNLHAETHIAVWGVSGGVFSNIISRGLLELSECRNCVIDGVVAASVKLGAPNGKHIHDCAISSVDVLGNDGDLDYGIQLYNAANCQLKDVTISVQRSGSDGVRILNNDDYGPNTIVLDSVTVKSHTRHGVSIVNSPNFANTTIRLIDLDVRTAGVYPIIHSSGSSISNGQLVMERCSVVGSPQLHRPLDLVVNGLLIVGDYNIMLQSGSSAWKAMLNNIVFRRSTPGTPLISFDGATSVAGLSIGLIEQATYGGFALYGTIGFAPGVKAWINGPVVENTTWADVLGANISAGSSYRLRGDATNWGYTHNGTAWVAKAH